MKQTIVIIIILLTVRYCKLQHKAENREKLEKYMSECLDRQRR